eukprot:5272738-Amphidinium_carterae.1
MFPNHLCQNSGCCSCQELEDKNKQGLDEQLSYVKGSLPNFKRTQVWEGVIGTYGLGFVGVVSHPAIGRHACRALPKRM